MKMKKLLSILLTVSVACTLMIGCSKKGGDSKEASSNKKIVIKLGHVEAEERSTHKASVEFKKYVEEQSKGAVTVEIYPNAQLGGDREMAEAVSLGTIQMTMPSTSVLTSYSPKFGILDMPFIFNNVEAAFKAVDSELGTELSKNLEKVGIHNFGYNYNGVRNTTNNKRPINEPKDFQGIKMRVMESPVFIDMFKCLGSNATPMGFGELFTALQQGTVDGQENAASLIYATKFQEVQKYLSLTNHTYGFLAVIINDKFYKGLPQDIQTIIADGAKKYLIDYQRSLELQDNDKYIKKLEEAGMKVNKVTDENHAKFVEAVKPMYDKYQKEIGQDMFDLAAKANK